MSISVYLVQLHFMKVAITSVLSRSPHVAFYSFIIYFLFVHPGSHHPKMALQLPCRVVTEEAAQQTLSAQSAAMYAESDEIHGETTQEMQWK